MSENSTGAAEILTEGRTALGIELGSTRIKAVLTGPGGVPLAMGAHSWENALVDGVWTYSLDAVETGLREAFAALATEVRRRHGVELTHVGALGVSAMMHGYLALDEGGDLLVPFRTWRNTSTGRAAERLTDLLGFAVPLRWSVAHHYQAILDGERHVPRLAHLTTLAGYVHQRLTGERVLGVGDASGMFPIDPVTGDYDERMLRSYDQLLRTEHGVTTGLRELLPRVLTAGEPAGRLTRDGALLLDPTGRLRDGIPLCPPEGDAGTGMVATHSIAPRSANVSAGTSIFAMVVLEQPLREVHPEIDVVTTPAGDPVAMVHCNNGASEIDAWAGVFGELATRLGSPADRGAVFATLFRASLEGEPDAGGLTAYNFLSGEPVAGVEHGSPLVVRTPGSRLTLANLVRAQLFGALATLRLGMDVLVEREQVRLDSLFAHGGLFATPGVAQGYLAAALRTPVTVGAVASEGGAWGMALLAEFLRTGRGRTLAGFLDEEVFSGMSTATVDPRPQDVAGYEAYLERYVAGLPVARAAGATAAEVPGSPADAR